MQISIREILVNRTNLQKLKKEFIAFDLETTGFSSINDRIVEIGAVRFVNGKEKETFSTLVHSDVPISPQALQVNGITNKMIATAPSESEAISKLVKFLGDALWGNTALCAHNAKFDMSFLQEALKRSQISAEITYVDTLSVTKATVKNLDNYQQDTILAYFNLSNLQAHRAQTDAICCGKILCKLFPLLETYVGKNGQTKANESVSQFLDWSYHESESNIKSDRPGKGKSLIDFPKSYCVIDIQTSGYSTYRDSIIEVAALKFHNNKFVDTFSALIKPDDFASKKSYLSKSMREHTGITNEMLSTASDTKTVLSKFMNFIGKDILVGHNVHYSINFLYDNIEKYFNLILSNDFIDTLRLAKRLLPDMPHSLCDLVEHYNCRRLTFHRALPDAQMTAQCFLKLVEDILSTYGSIEEFRKTFKHKSGLRHNIKIKDITAISNNFDISHPLYEKICVFSGELEKMSRKEAMQTVVNAGGQVAGSVTKKTNYLITNDINSKTSKLKKAKQLIAEGYEIEIITEKVFYDMITKN